MSKVNKTNILLDLDNTLISSISPDEERKVYKSRMKKFRWEDMEGEYKVFERPDLQPFLDFLFQNFNVSVWTAASKTYASFIIDRFILKGHPERKLHYIFFSYHCKLSKKIKTTQKSLDLLSQYFKLADFKNDTYIIDDHPEVFRAQPDRCIAVKPFEFTERQSFNDRELENVQKHLRTYLDRTTKNVTNLKKS